MTLSDEQIRELEQADLAVRTAKALYDHARDERTRSIRRIAAEGGTYREIGERSGVAYQRVAQLVTGKEPPMRDRDDELRYDCPKCGAKVGDRCDHPAGGTHYERYIQAIQAFRDEHPELG